MLPQRAGLVRSLGSGRRTGDTAFAAWLGMRLLVRHDHATKPISRDSADALLRKHPACGLLHDVGVEAVIAVVCEGFARIASVLATAEGQQLLARSVG